MQSKRQNRVHKSMNRPLTILGAERGLFFTALCAGAGVFNLLHSLIGGLLLFVIGLVAAQWATRYDPQILRVLLNSSKFRALYDPGKYQKEMVLIRDAATRTN
jgi:type IV secretory pathway TrbD component